VTKRYPILNDISDVVFASLSTGHTLKYDGANWINQIDNPIVSYTDVAPPSPVDGQLWVNPNGSGGGGGTALDFAVEHFYYKGTLAVTTGVLRLPMHVAGTIVSVRATVNTAPTGQPIIVDLTKTGTTMYTTRSNRPTIAVSTNSVVATLPNVTTLAAGDYLTVDIDQVGSGTAGADLVVSVRYSYTG
jgi:hypothetical protein